MDPTDQAAFLDRVRAIYDEITPLYVAHCSETIQAGLFSGPRPDDAWPPTASNLWLAARAGVQPGERVLDLGCGVCGPACDLVRAYEGLTVDAVTLSPVQARMARERVAEAGLSDRITVHEADYHELAFADGAYDRVLCLESTGYSYDPDRLFAGIFRVLRPGGQLYIKDLYAKPGPYTEQEVSEIEGVNRLWEQAQVPTMADWHARLEAAGFTGVAHERLTEATSQFYWGAMFTDTLSLNPLGERLFKDFPTGGLVFYGEVRGTKPG